MIQALLPIIVLLVLGYACRQTRFLPDAGWRALERISYYIFFPALIVKVLQGADLSSVPIGFILALLAAQLILGGIGLLALAFERSSRDAVGPIVQSNVRWNTFVALAMSETLFGAPGLALVAIAAAVLIPLANLISVTALLHFSNGDEGQAPRGSILVSLVKNPLLMACVIGIALSLTQLPLPAVALDTLDLLSRPAIALGLVTAGAAVTFKSISSRLGRTLSWSLVRLILLPVVGFGLGTVLGLEAFYLTIIVICCATPTAVNGYILAKELGGDAALAANLISIQTVLSAVTLPLMIWLAEIWL
ncbi:MAG: AEC family transporter [Henriciella sp.]|nr:AEC family transporter [Henriciella sp.]